MQTTASTILIGENHGVRQNAQFVKAFVDDLISQETIAFVGFEYPIFARHDFIKAVEANNFALIEKNEVAQMLIKDGRFSKDHFDLLVHLHQKQIPFIFFDSGKGAWDDRDADMYKNISEARKNKRGKIILIAGNIHTTLTPLNLDNKPYKPLGTYFDKRDVLLIELKYRSGEFFNFGRKKFPTIKPSKKGFGKVKDSHVFYHIPVATPTQ